MIVTEQQPILIVTHLIADSPSVYVTRYARGRLSLDSEAQVEADRWVLSTAIRRQTARSGDPEFVVFAVEVLVEVQKAEKLGGSELGAAVVDTVVGMRFVDSAVEVVMVDRIARKVAALGSAEAYSQRRELAREGNFSARDEYLRSGSAFQVQCEVVGEQQSANYFASEKHKLRPRLPGRSERNFRSPAVFDLWEVMEVQQVQSLARGVESVLVVTGRASGGLGEVSKEAVELV